MSTSLGRIPKLASAQKTYSILWAANHSTSRYSLSTSQEETLLATAEPQSQNVQAKGHPLLVSHMAIHCCCGLVWIRESKMPSRYGEGTPERSFSLAPRAF